MYNKIHPFKMYIFMSWDTCILLCKHHHKSKYRIFLSPQKVHLGTFVVDPLPNSLPHAVSNL